MFTNTIGEKKAKEILSYCNLDTLPTLKLFAQQGKDIIPSSLLDILTEINSLSHLRMAYDDILKLRSYFEQFIPNEIQLQVMYHYGYEKLLNYIKK